jgi:hypothetical protein
VQLKLTDEYEGSVCKPSNFHFFGEIELAIVQGSLEPIKWHHAIYLLLNRHDTLISKLQAFASKAKTTLSKLVLHSN